MQILKLGSVSTLLHQLLLLFLPKTNASDALDEVLLRSIMPPINTKCQTTASSYAGQTSSHTFQHYPSPSFWDRTALPSEPELFQAEMSNANTADPDKSWTIRFGSAGNIYSLRGAYGEAIPPQYHPKGEWVDEVTQSVAVNLQENGSADYFMHQAGVYSKDSPYNDTHFFSPSIAKHCSDKECFFASWGQQAHVPTKHISNTLYFNGYRDCGDGIIEFTTIIHNSNHAPNEYTNYHNTPWGGVRSSSLRDIFVSLPDGSITQKYPIVTWSSDPATYDNVGVSGGFTTFTERVVPDPVLYNGRSPFQMPTQNGTPLEITINGNAQHLSGHSANWGGYCMRVPVVANFLTTTGCKKQCNLELENSNTGAKVYAPTIIHFAHQQQWFYFCLRKGSTTNDFNDIFDPGDKVLVSWANEGKPFNDNKALMIVHGRWLSWFEHRPPSRTRYGIGGIARRDYTVYTTNTRQKIRPGSTYVYTQYLATGRLSDMQATGNDWKPQVYEDMFDKTDYTGTAIHLYSKDMSSFGAYIDGGDDCLQGSSVCVGSSLPEFNKIPLFFVTCGSNTYVGSNKYHFSPTRASVNDDIRSYACAGEATNVRPTWKLLGYFEDGSCSALELGIYDTTFCSTPDPKDPWLIGDLSFEVNPSDNEIYVSHPVAGNPDNMNVKLFDKNCINEVNDTTVTIPDQGYNSSMKSFSYDININVTEIDSSSLVIIDNSTAGTGDSKGTMVFCTRVVTVYTGKSFDVTFRETNFEMNFDLTNNNFTGFSLENITIEDKDADNFQTDVDTEFSVNAYLCDDTYSSIPSTTAYQQNEALKVCLTPSSNFVEISNFEMQMISADGHTYEPVSYGNQNYDADPLTTVVKDPSGSTDTLKVTTIIVANMFLGGGTSVDIVGNAFLKFKSSKSVRKNGFTSFRLNVNIGDDTSRGVGCFEALLQRAQTLLI